MNDTLVSGIPSLARLRADRGLTYQLTDSGGDRLAAELRHVREGRAMGRRYQCYAAQLALPRPAAQDVYTVRSGDDEWALLLTPIGPDEDGQPLMEALFHVLKEEQPESGVTDASSSRK
jgi:hypothetical protein